MKNLFLTVAFTLAGGALFAQATPATPATPAEPATQEAKRACPMPDMKEVQSLELSQEQLMQVREIHAECERKCATAKKENGEVDHTAMAEYQARVQEVLTPEQYEQYQALKADKKADEKADEKDAQMNIEE